MIDDTHANDRPYDIHIDEVDSSGPKELYEFSYAMRSFQSHEYPSSDLKTESERQTRPAQLAIECYRKQPPPSKLDRCLSIPMNSHLVAVPNYSQRSAFLE